MLHRHEKVFMNFYIHVKLITLNEKEDIQHVRAFVPFEMRMLERADGTS